MGKQLFQYATGGIALIDDASSASAAIVGSLSWNVARGVTNTVIVGTLPANARIVAIFVTTPVVSNAVTTATVSIGLAGGSATAFTAAQDIKTAVGNFSQTPTAGWVAATTSQSITSTYTETGGASTLGNSTVNVLYCTL